MFAFRFMCVLAVLVPTGCKPSAPAAPVPVPPVTKGPRVPVPSADAARPAIPESLAPIVMLIERGQFGPAREAIESYRSGKPDDPAGAFINGLVYHKARRYEEAQPLFERALELDPQYAVVHHFLGYCKFHRGDTAGAAESFRRNLAAMPRECDSHFGLGLALLQEGDLAGAEGAFLTSIACIRELEGSNPALFDRRKRDLGKAHARLADVAFAREDYAEARRNLIEAIEYDPNQYTAYFTLSQVERRLGHDERADELQAMYEKIMDARRTPAPEQP